MTYTVSSGTLNPSVPYHTIDSTAVSCDVISWFYINVRSKAGSVKPAQSTAQPEIKRKKN